MDREHLDYFLRKLGITDEELASYMEDDRRHMKYQTYGALLSLYHKARNAVSGT